MAHFIGETNFVNGRIAELDEWVTIDVGGAMARGGANGRSLQIGQSVSLAIRPEKINLYPQGKVDVLKAEAGLDREEVAKIFGTEIPSSEVNMRDWLEAEVNNVVMDGRITETIYIGTDTRYRVEIVDNASIFVRVQNYGSRYDTQFNVGDPVYVHWAAENAQVLTG